MQETNSIQEVQKALGHKHVETTLRYLLNFEKLGDILGLI
jgi:site-specific recombinase XerC